MAKKTNKQLNTGNQPVGKQPPPVKPVQKVNQFKSTQPAEGNFLVRYSNVIIPLAIAIITWLFLKTCLDNQYTNWDDPGYIRDNGYIKDLSGPGLSNIFSAPIMGNYHPLTVLSYAIEYSFVRLDPWLYHLDSLLFHIIVTVLVYWFVKFLTGRQVAAGIVALLFGLHPMHVESVAWLSGRKDVVYGMFYMAACIAYIYFVRADGAKKWKFYGAVVLLFICSLLGKPVAVVLPVTLLLIDYFEKRALNLRLLIEKTPLFLISIGFGIKSVLDQQKFGGLNTQDVSYTFAERFALGGYAFITYLWKAVVPVSLCNFYPYPEKVHDSMPFEYYIYPLGVIAILAGLWSFARKNRVVMFGSLFFIVNIALLLQFIPVGGAIVADRYTYIPYLGLFFILGWVVSEFFQPGAKRQTGLVMLSIVLGYSLVLGYMANERCKVWYDTTSLWRDEIEKEPRRAPNAWNNLGFNYFNKFNDAVNPADKKRYYDSAYFLLNKAIELQPNFVNPFISIGELQRSVGNFPDAKANYYHAISIKGAPNEVANAYLGLAIIYAISHNFDSSGFCFRTAITLKPYFPEAHSNFGNFYDMVKQYDSALVQYGIAVDQNPDMYAPHLNRARLLQRLKRYPEALKDFQMAVDLSPDNGEVYYSRALCHGQMGNNKLALADMEKAKALGFKVNEQVLQELRGK